MRHIMLIGLVILLAGCSPDVVDIVEVNTVEYTVIPPEDIPDKYPDGAFSIKGLLANRSQYENKSIIVRGIVSFKYECPPCPRGAFCEMCAPDHIYLGDPIENITSNFILPGHELIINFIPQSREVYNPLKIGQEVTINTTHYSRRGGMSMGRIGTFVYNNLTSLL